MKSYIITIIGAAVLSAMSGILAPEKWRGYVKIITGLVIISCIITPAVSMLHSDIFTGFNDSFEAAAEGGDLQKNIVKEELEKRINADIENRMRTEFNMDITAKSEIAVNDNGEVEGVRLIRIYGGKLTDRARARLCEVYGINTQEVRDD